MARIVNRKTHHAPRPPEEIRTDMRTLERESEGPLAEIVGDVS